MRSLTYWKEIFELKGAHLVRVVILKMLCANSQQFLDLHDVATARIRANFHCELRVLTNLARHCHESSHGDVGRLLQSEE